MAISITKITKIIKDLGISANLKGYHYIRYVMEISQTNKYVTCHMMQLYDIIAEKFQDTPANVERAIRHAVQKGWDRGNQELIDELFGNTINAETGVPTNSEFLATLVDYTLTQPEDV
jgi:two-component system response regulator (stage 0 sporulation protein A)